MSPSFHSRQTMTVTVDGDDEYQHEVCCDRVEGSHVTDAKRLSSEISATTSSGVPSSSSSSRPPPVVIGRSSKEDLLSEQFELYGWSPDPLLSDDENYLDLVFIITRNPARRRRRRHLVAEKTCSVGQTVVNNNDGGRGFCDGGGDDDDDNDSNDDSTSDKKLTSSLSTAIVGADDDAPRSTKWTLPPITPGSHEYQPQGHMGALIVRPMTTDKTPRAIDDDRSGGIRNSNNTCDDERDLEVYEARFWESILGAGTNMPLFITDDNESGQNRDDADENRKKVRTAANKKTTKPKADIHAEISALGQACKSCQSTENCTAYITIHPCKNCFGALVAFGITRIVTRQAKENWSSVTLRTALSKGLQVHTLTHDESRNQMERINQLVNNNTNNEIDETGQKGIVRRTDEELMAMAEAKRQHRQERKLQAKMKRQQGH